MITLDNFSTSQVTVKSHLKCAIALSFIKINHHEQQNQYSQNTIIMPHQEQDIYICSHHECRNLPTYSQSVMFVVINNLYS
jgi:single-stranded DNA-specific DHH superfamily exonuclease